MKKDIFAKPNEPVSLAGGVARPLTGKEGGRVAGLGCDN